MEKELLTKLKEMVLNRYNPEHCGYTEQESEGNSSDVFQDGFDCGESQLLYEIGVILGLELPEPEEQEYDF
jgi:hypothetical protein